MFFDQLKQVPISYKEDLDECMIGEDSDSSFHCISDKFSFWGSSPVEIDRLSPLSFCLLPKEKIHKMQSDAVMSNEQEMAGSYSDTIHTGDVVSCQNDGSLMQTDEIIQERDSLISVSDDHVDTDIDGEDCSVEDSMSASCSAIKCETIARTEINPCSSVGVRDDYRDIDGEEFSVESVSCSSDSMMMSQNISKMDRSSDVAFDSETIVRTKRSQCVSGEDGNLELDGEEFSIKSIACSPHSMISEIFSQTKTDQFKKVDFDTDDDRNECAIADAVGSIDGILNTRGLIICEKDDNSGIDGENCSIDDYTCATINVMQTKVDIRTERELSKCTDDNDSCIDGNNCFIENDERSSDAAIQANIFSQKESIDDENTDIDGEEFSTEGKTINCDTLMARNSAAMNEDEYLIEPVVFQADSVIEKETFEPERNSLPRQEAKVIDIDGEEYSSEEDLDGELYSSEGSEGEDIDGEIDSSSDEDE